MNVTDGSLSHPPSSSALPRDEVAGGFQIAGFVSPGLRNFYLEKACLLVEYKAGNISFHRYMCLCLVAQSCPTLRDPMNCKPARVLCPWGSPGRILEWGAISFSRGSSWPRDRTQVSCITGSFFTIWATMEVAHICVCVDLIPGLS